jgi:transcription elongation factor Elf1
MSAERSPATEEDEMATGTKTAKGFKVTCPFCGDQEATVRIDLNNVNVIVCTSCDEEFSPSAAVAKVADQLRRWEAVARWVEMAGEAMADPSAE